MLEQLSVTRKGWLTFFSGVVLSVILLGCTPARSEPRIWYTHESVAGNSIRALDPTQGNLRTVVSYENEGMQNPRLSPDGKHLVYTRLHGRTANSEEGMTIWVTPTDPVAPEQIIALHRFAAGFWLDDSTVILQVSDDRQIAIEQVYVYDLDTKELRSLEIQAPPGSCNPNRTGSTSKRVSFVSNRNPALGQYLVSDSALGRRIDFEIDLAAFPEVVGGECVSSTPDGSKVAFLASFKPPIFYRDVFFAEDQGKTVRRLTHFVQPGTTNGVRRHAISPDGRWVFLEAVSGSPKLFLASTDGTLLKELGDWEARSDPVWSPDSQYVAVTLVRPDGDQSVNEVYSINSATGEIKQLTSEGAYNYVFDWR